MTFLLTLPKFICTMFIVEVMSMKKTTIPKDKYIAWYEDICMRYNVQRHADIETRDVETIQKVYEATCNALGLPSKVQPNKISISPAQMEAYFMRYVASESYKEVTVSFTNYGDANTIVKPTLLSVAGFKWYLYRETGVQPYTSTALLSNGDFIRTRALIYTFIEDWAWSNSGRTLGEIDINSSRLLLETRVNPFVVEHETRSKNENDDDKITPEVYRNAVLEALQRGDDESRPK